MLCWAGLGWPGLGCAELWLWLCMWLGWAELGWAVAVAVDVHVAVAGLG